VVVGAVAGAVVVTAGVGAGAAVPPSSSNTCGQPSPPSPAYRFRAASWASR
jgi:hypothetical protein